MHYDRSRSSSHRQSPLVRRKRGASATDQQFVEIQWRFLQHHNPAPPQFRSSALESSSDNSKLLTMSPRSPTKLLHLLEDPQLAEEIMNERLQSQATRSHDYSSNRVLNDITGETQRKEMLMRIMAEMQALALESETNRRQLEHKEEEVQPSSPTNDVAGFRKQSRVHDALRSSISSAGNTGIGILPCLDTTEPITLLPRRKLSTIGTITFGDANGLQTDGSTSDAQEDEEDDDDDEADDGEQAQTINDGKTGRPMSQQFRHLRKQHLHHHHQLQLQQQHGTANQEPRILWQKTSRVKVAQDVPLVLQIPVQLKSPTIMHTYARKRASIIGQHALHSFARQASEIENVVVPSSPVFEKVDDPRKIMHQRPTNLLTKSACISPRSPRKVTSPSAPSTTTTSASSSYGSAWYVPQTNWWALHQTSTTANSPTIAPLDQTMTPQATARCRHSHPLKPAVPWHVLSSPPSPSKSSPIIAAPSPSAHPPLTPQTTTVPPSALQLQVGPIPHSYIGKEYKEYILNRGSALPSYLLQ